MSGRDAARVFNGATSRAIAHAVRAAIARHGTPAQAMATCPDCSGPLTFSREPLTGHTLERCAECGRSVPVVRLPAAVLEEHPIPMAPNARQCERCGAELPEGKVGMRRARFCRARRACIKASQGRALTPAAPALTDDMVLEKLPPHHQEARRLRDVAAELTEFSTEQVRRKLVRLVHRGRVRTTVHPHRRVQGGRNPLRYWRAA